MKTNFKYVRPELKEAFVGLAEQLLLIEKVNSDGSSRSKAVIRESNFVADNILAPVFERPFISIPHFAIKELNDYSQSRYVGKDYDCDLYELPKEEYARLYQQGLECFFKPFFNDCVYHLHYTKRTQFGGSVVNDRFIKVDLDKGEGIVVLGIRINDLETRKHRTTSWHYIPFKFDVDDKETLNFHIDCPVTYDAETKEVVYGDNAAVSFYSVLGVEQLVRGESPLAGPDDSEAIRDVTDNLMRDEPIIFPKVHRYVSSLLNMLIEQLGYLHINDYYSFEVKPKGIKRKKGSGITGRKKAEALARRGPKVLFLNKINPEWQAKNEHGQLTPVTREGHQRRGTWWTMKAEKYRYHPNYLKPKANYRKSSWVGPENFEYQGNTYKILLNEEDSVRDAVNGSV